MIQMIKHVHKLVGKVFDAAYWHNLCDVRDSEIVTLKQSVTSFEDKLNQYRQLLASFRSSAVAWRSRCRHLEKSCTKLDRVYKQLRIKSERRQSLIQALQSDVEFLTHDLQQRDPELWQKWCKRQDRLANKFVKRQNQLMQEISPGV